MTSSRLLLGIIAALTYCHLSATDPDQGAFRRELIDSIQDPFSRNDVTVVVRPLAALERSRKVNFAVVLKMRDEMARTLVLCLNAISESIFAAKLQVKNEDLVIDYGGME